MPVTIGPTDPPNTSQKLQFKNAFDLGNVDNTSDMAKPVSTATQAALDAKADASVIGDISAALSSINGV